MGRRAAAWRFGQIGNLGPRHSFFEAPLAHDWGLRGGRGWGGYPRVLWHGVCGRSPSVAPAPPDDGLPLSAVQARLRHAPGRASRGVCILWGGGEGAGVWGFGGGGPPPAAGGRARIPFFFFFLSLPLWPRLTPAGGGALRRRWCGRPRVWQRVAALAARERLQGWEGGVVQRTSRERRRRSRRRAAGHASCRRPVAPGGAPCRRRRHGRHGHRRRGRRPRGVTGTNQAAGGVGRSDGRALHASRVGGVAVVGAGGAKASRRGSVGFGPPWCLLEGH